MTRTARIVGSILTIISGAFLILGLVSSISVSVDKLFLVVIMIVGASFIDGGIILITDRTIGGILALIGSNFF